MSQLSNVAMYLELTREKILRPADQVINDTAKRNYTLARFIRNRPANVIVRTGDKIVDEVKLEQSGNYTEIEPGQPRSITGGGSRQQWQAHWRFAENHKPIVKAQTTLNRGMDQETVIKNLGDQFRDDLTQAHIDGHEGRIWGQADVLMETEAELKAARPFSIPTFITEQTAPVGFATQGTLENINFTTYPNWDNQRKGYDSANPFGSNGILSAFDQMQLLVGFVPPTGKGADAFTADQRSRMMIFTNANGINIFKACCRAGNDRFFKAGNDPAYRSVEWDGAELIYAAQLDTALLEQSSGTAYSGAAYTTGSPRYFWVNGEYTFPIFHPEHYCNEVMKDGGVQYPDVEVMFMESMWQFVMTSRKRHGIIAPLSTWLTS